MENFRIKNRRIVLHSRPEGMPALDNFRLETVPVLPPGPGEILVKTLYLSLDPYMRGRMYDRPSYVPPVALNDVMVGGAVSRVEASGHPDFQVGDHVVGRTGWQEYAVSDGCGLIKLDAGLTHLSLALGVLGMTGFTAYMGLLDIGQPKAGETLVVAAASGGVGSAVGQIAKIKGCRVVGIAGGEEKCRYVVDELGFDECLDHRSPDFPAQLIKACPNGIDIYFELVGGPIFDAVLPLLNTNARIPLCGTIATLNDTSPPTGPDRMTMLIRNLLVKRARMQGFIIFEDYGQHFGEFYRQMSTWLQEGKIKYREDVVVGLENAPQAFLGMLVGGNFGKMVVKVA